MGDPYDEAVKNYAASAATLRSTTADERAAARAERANVDPSVHNRPTTITDALIDTYRASRAKRAAEDAR
jgi:hypothetical protein